MPIPPSLLPGGPLAVMGEVVLNRSAFGWGLHPGRRPQVHPHPHASEGGLGPRVTTDAHQLAALDAVGKLPKDCHCRGVSAGHDDP